jgi:hypothetical protein
MGKLCSLMGKENETFLMIFDVGNFWRKIFYTVVVLPDTEPLNYFPHSFNMLK